MRIGIIACCLVVLAFQSCAVAAAIERNARAIEDQTYRQTLETNIIESALRKKCEP